MTWMHIFPENVCYQLHIFLSCDQLFVWWELPMQRKLSADSSHKNTRYISSARQKCLKNLLLNRANMEKCRVLKELRCFCILDVGHVYAFGENKMAQLGLGNQSPYIPSPTRVSPIKSNIQSFLHIPYTRGQHLRSLKLFCFCNLCGVIFKFSSGWDEWNNTRVCVSLSEHMFLCVSLWSVKTFVRLLHLLSFSHSLSKNSPFMPCLCLDIY